MKTVIQRLTKSKLLSLGIKFGLTFAAFAYVFSFIEFSHLKEILQEQDHALILGAAVFILCQLYLGGLRWRMITIAIADDPKSLSHAQTIKYAYISAFFNCCLPGTVGGDVVRVWLAKSDRLSMSLSIYSVVIDRVLSLIALVVLIFATLPVFSEMAGFMPLPVLFGTLALTATGIVFAAYFDRMFARFKGMKIIQMVSYFIGCLRMLLVHKKASLLSLIFGVVAHICYCMAGWLLAKSLSIDMTLLQAVTLLPLVLLATTLPISMGGWGVREASAIGLLGLIGISKAGALLLSIQMGLVTVLICLPAGLMWLVHNKRKSMNLSQ